MGTVRILDTDNSNINKYINRLSELADGFHRIGERSQQKRTEAQRTTAITLRARIRTGIPLNSQDVILLKKIRAATSFKSKVRR